MNAAERANVAWECLYQVAEGEIDAVVRQDAGRVRFHVTAEIDGHVFHREIVGDFVAGVLTYDIPEQPKPEPFVRLVDDA